ncbi:MAG: glutamine synthetase family protein [Bacillota bacterium]
MKTVEQILAEVKEKNIELIRFLYTDNDSVIRGYTTTGSELESDLMTGHSYTKGMAFFSALDILGPDTKYTGTGEFSAVPDLDTFRVLPHVPNTASVLCDFVQKDTHEPTGLCSRSILKQYLSELEFEVKIACENEFYLLKRNETGKLVPFDNSICFATTGMNESHNVILTIIRALQEQGIIVEKHYPEYGPGQHEIIIKYDDALKACDNQIYFRETVRGMARVHGLVASFMPKPFEDLAGSGCHLHVSLWKNGKNIFYDPKDEIKLSDTARYFIGGVLKHINALLAFTAPIVTSYKRLIPHNWASAYSCYGLDNREAAIRVVSGMKGKEEKTTHFEFKPADGTCNPYLALTALLAAGMDGIKNKIDPGQPVVGDPDNMCPEERKKRGITRFPDTLGEAIKALDEDKLFEKVFGKEMYKEYITMKYYNWIQFARHVTQKEIDKYAEIF